MRSLLTDVSAVSDAAANAARMRETISRRMRSVIQWPRLRSQRAALTVWSPEHLADAAALVHTNNRLSDQGCDAEHVQARMVIEAAGPVGQRDGVGDADLIDRCLVQQGQRAVGEHSVGGDDVDSRRAL